jgi:glycosyltransferase family protein
MSNLLYELGLRPPYPKYLDSLETIKLIKKQSLSLARFGDCEFNLMFDGPCIFQKNDPDLSVDLLETLNSKQENLLIGIPDIFKSLKIYIKPSRQYWRKYLKTERAKIYGVLDFEKIYVDSMITRFNMKSMHSATYIEEVLNGWKQVWENRPVLRVTGESAKRDYSSDLFDNASELNTIITLSENAYAVIDDLLLKITTYPIDTIVILSLGPTAAVLAYRLAKLGYQALDVGHLEVAYTKENDKKVN